MTDLRIDELVKDGWWIQVSPLANEGSGWICGIYKRGKKTGNWSTVESRKFKTPNDCYHWATLKIKYEKL